MLFSEVVQLVIDPFKKRFDFHFNGDKQTNDPTKPEWFLSQVMIWIDNNSEYFEVYIQNLFSEVGLTFNINQFVDTPLSVESERVCRDLSCRVFGQASCVENSISVTETLVRCQSTTFLASSRRNNQL